MAKLLSLFDGSGGFPLAAAMCGIVPVMASEVEPYPIAVTRSRFPQMEHLGDVSKVNGAEIEPVDIISFGSPCQDLSVAGKRAGLKHEDNGDDETTRSGLFMEAIRIIKEMREATNGLYPTFALWENVPGAFSSNKGEDFRVVLEEFCKICEPSAEMPPADKNGWPYADVILGDGWSVGYRTFDAQYWGVPQRRRRIYLVADFRGERSAKILFERKGLRRDFKTGREKRENSTGSSEDSSDTADGSREPSYLLKIRSGVERDTYGKKAGKGPLIQKEKSATLGTSQDQYLFTVPLETFSKERRAQNKDDFETWRKGGVANTLNTFDNGDVRATDLAVEVHQPVVCYSFDALSSNSMKSSNPISGCREVEIAKTLDTTNQDPSKNQGGIAVVQTYDARGNGNGKVVSTITGDHNGHISDYTSLVVEKEPVFYEAYQHHGWRESEVAGVMTEKQNIFVRGDTPLVLETAPLNQVIPLEGNGSRPSHRGKGWNESDKMFSLNTTEVHAVAYATGNGQSQNMRLSTQVGTLDCMHDQKIVLQPCYWDGSQTTGTLTANNAGGNQRMPDKENFNCILDVFSRQRTDEYKENDTASTLSARDYKSATDLIVLKENDNG